MNYTDLNTKELIDQLFKDEDRVKYDLIHELISRGEEAAPRLREILEDEYFWYEGLGGEHFIVVHAMIVLSATGDSETLPLLIKFAEHAYFANHHYACETLPMALAEYGPKAIDPLMDAITELRGAYRDNQDYSYVRHDFSTALLRIAADNPEFHERVSEFIYRMYENEHERDAYFLSLSASHPYILNKDSGIQLLINAHKRGVISEAITGKFDSYIKRLKSSDESVFEDFLGSLLDFYQHEAYQYREDARIKEKAQKLYWGVEAISEKSVGRNDPCPCGSGKKYKKCCGA